MFFKNLWFVASMVHTGVVCACEGDILNFCGENAANKRRLYECLLSDEGNFDDEDDSKEYFHFVEEKLRQYREKGEWCPCSVLRAYKSGDVPLMNTVMNVVFWGNLDIIYSENQDAILLLGEEDRRRKLAPSVEMIIADALCHPRQHIPLWQVAYNVHTEGYRYTSFSDFRNQYKAVRVVMGYPYVETYTHTNAFSFFARKHNATPETLPKYVQSYERGFNCHLRFAAKKIAQYVISMPEKTFLALQEKSAGTIIPKSRKVKSVYDDQSVRAIIDQHCAQLTVCEYQEIKNVMLKANTGTVMALKYVLHYVFKTNMDLEYNLVDHRYSFWVQREDVVTPHIPVEVMVAATCCTKRVSSTDRAVWGYRAYKAGYDFDDYEDFDDMFSAVCIVLDIGTTQSSHIVRCQKFFQFMKESQVKKSLRNKISDYRAKGEIIKDEDVVFIERAQTLEASGVLGVYQAWFQGSILQFSLVEKVLLEQAKQGDVCSWRLLDLCLFQPKGQPDAVLTEMMKMVFVGQTHIIYDFEKKQYTRLSQPRQKKITQNIWVFILHNIQTEPSWKKCHHVYAVYDAGYTFSPQHVEDMVQVLETFYANVLSCPQKVRLCQAILCEHVALISAVESAIQQNLALTNVEKKFILDMAYWVHEGRFNKQEIFDLLGFCGGVEATVPVRL